MTALQELIQKLESFKKELKEKYDGDPLVTLGFSVAINEAKELLEKEKQQIILSYEQGYQDGRAEHYMSAEFDGAEHYFKETYKQ